MNTFRPDAYLYLTGQLHDQPYPPGITHHDGDGRFDYQGSVLPWPGNTIICHIKKDSAEHRALWEVQEALKSATHADAFTFLPPASFHMTVFQGINCFETDSEAWPTGIPRSTERDAVSDILLQRLENTPLPQSHHIRPVDIFAGHSVTVEGADSDHELLLRQTREQLRTATGIRPDLFDTYTFHITLAYLARWLNDSEAESVIALSDTLAQQLQRQAPTIELGSLEFCNFEDMHRFDVLKRLGSQD